MRVTTPVGVPIAGAAAETAAVKVTGRPNGAGLKLETSPTVVPPWLTVCVRAADMALVTLVSPEYDAVPPPSGRNPIIPCRTSC